MAINTQCPACSTVFSVPPSAMAASGGWVRCGRCSEVFDASAHQHNGASRQQELIDDQIAQQLNNWPAQVPDARALLAKKLGNDNPRPEPRANLAHLDAAIDRRSTSHSNPTSSKRPPAAVPDAEPAKLVSSRRVAAGATESPPTPLPRKPEAAKGATETRRQKTPPQQEKSVKPAARQTVPETQSRLPLEDERSGSFEEPGFEPSAAQPSVTEFASTDDSLSAPTWLGAVVGIVGLSLLLMAQFLLSQRHELATFYPGLRPTLSALCAPLGCQIKPLRQLENVAIDTTSFQAFSASDKGDRYLLTWSVSNQALYPVAAPALELTLNDVLDRPLLRKVLLPKDLGSPDLVVAPEGKWTGSVQLAVTPPEGGIKVSGYRLLAFYP